MKNYAVLLNNVVTNVIVASSLEVAEQATSSNCVFIEPGTMVEIGYTYSDGTFTK